MLHHFYVNFKLYNAYLKQNNLFLIRLFYTIRLIINYLYEYIENLE
jgi:hypothetical protein